MRLDDGPSTSPERVVWYGREPPRPDLIRSVANADHLAKPIGGIWTSPHDSEYGWDAWCRVEMPNWLTDRYLLDVRPAVSLLVIDSMADLDQAWEHFPGEEGVMSGKTLDFKKISQEYDGIWLTEEGQWATRHPPTGSGWFMGLYGWDVETVWFARWVFTKIRRTRKGTHAEYP